VRRKFNIGHEMGHMLYMKYRGGEYIFNCEDNDQGTICGTLDSSHGNHAIHTKERSSCAFAEGFAHFVAADVFNDHLEQDGIFYYYKSLYDPLLNIETGPTGGISKFLEMKCMDPKEFRGVELDWLRAFWHYHARPGAQLRPTHEQIFRHVKDTHDDPGFLPVKKNVHQLMLNNAPTSLLITRWSDAGVENGINH
jgi:hypothetical protein